MQEMNLIVYDVDDTMMTLKKNRTKHPSILKAYFIWK